ncbi:MAG: hypothetical protein M0R22_07955 [Dehalococcoidia bacterium]|nr:hypothetical protein [Dehalococcoidia bacterium]
MPKIYAWFLAVLLTYVLWALITHGAPFLVYLSNWLYVVNTFFFAGVVIAENSYVVRRATLLASLPLLGCDIMWAVYTVGLAVFGASCFTNTQSSTFFRYVFSFAQAYGHFTPLIILCLYVAVHLSEAARTWARLLDRIVPPDRIGAAVVVFAATFTWLLVPTLPCIVYSYVTDPLVIYGLSVSLVQISYTLIYSVLTESVVMFLAWVLILWHRSVAGPKKM